MKSIGSRGGQIGKIKPKGEYKSPIVNDGNYKGNGNYKSHTFSNGT